MIYAVVAQGLYHYYMNVFSMLILITLNDLNLSVLLKDWTTCGA